MSSSSPIPSTLKKCSPRSGSRKGSAALIRDTSNNDGSTDSSLSSIGSSSEAEEHSLLNKKETIREHHVILHSNRTAQKRIMKTKQEIFLPSAKQKWLHQRRKKGMCMRKYVTLLLTLVGLVALLNVTDDLSASLQMSRHTRALWMQHNYANLSLKDADFPELVQEVDNWCLEASDATTVGAGSSTSGSSGLGLLANPDHFCTTCQDPTIPSSRNHLSHWKRTQELNLKQLRQSKENSKKSDILFLGDSITEGWRGTSYGVPIARTEGVRPVFEEYFPNAIANGISADTCANLLWRITQGGELIGDSSISTSTTNEKDDSSSSSTFPTTPNPPPKLVVVLIGTNDLGNDFCSPEMVVLGILSVVQELRRRLPASSTAILIHGLLPRTFDRKGHVLKGRRTPWILGGGWHHGTTSTSGSSGSSTSTRRHLRRRRKSALPSLWNDVRQVNRQLQRFVTAQDVNTTNLYYYNLPLSTWLIENDEDDDDENENENDDDDDSSNTNNTTTNIIYNNPILNATLMPDYLHPSKVGYQIWAQELSQETERILEIQDERRQQGTGSGLLDNWF